MSTGGGWQDQVGGYIGARPDSIQALKEMQKVAVLMKFHLERGEIDARFISGAGVDGSLMVLLKKSVSKEQLRKRLLEIFQDSGVDVWESQFV